MENTHYSYNGKSWRPSPTVSDYNSFFHSAFGVKTDENGYFDKHAKFRRMHWITFLTYFENEEMPSCLTAMLTKCFSINDTNVSSDFEEDLTKYICGLSAGKLAVTKEDVAILATLQNTKIVIFSNGGLHPITVIEPNLNILGSYPTEVSKEKPREVVLYHEENIFTRLEPVREESCSEPNKIKVQKKTDPSKYRKGGSAGSKGVEYQISLIAMVILKVMKTNLIEWKLSTENDDAGKFDDIVLEWTEGTVLIQSKHKEDNKKRITLEELTSTNSKNDDFSLPKYFLSYMLIKEKFNIKNVIICTNVGIHQNVLKFLNREMADPENLLQYENGECSFYTLNDAILPNLKEKTILYYDQNFKNKGIPKSVITEENLTDFFNKLQLYFNYPPLKSLEKIIENLLSSISCCNNRHSKVTPLEIYSKVMDWFQQKEGVYFTDIYAKAMFAEIWTGKYCQKLKHYKMSLQKNELNFRGKKQIFQVSSSHGNLLKAIKAYYAVQNEKTLFVNPDDDMDTQKLILEAFALPQYVFLIINQLKVMEESVIKEMCANLQNVLSKKKYKKVILMTRNNDVFSRYLEHEIDYETINGSVTFADLSKDFQEKLLKRKSIVFQGKPVCLQELLADQTTEYYVKATSEEILENMIIGEVTVGVQPSDMDENIAPFYVNRTFKRSLENIYEDDIYDVDESVVLISNNAGVGKTTVLSKLAKHIKNRNPHLWVIKIALTEYTHVLRDLKNGGGSISIMKLLNSKQATKLTNCLEKFVFSMEKKVVLMLDGIDEISPDYTELVHNLLAQCLQTNNFAKVFVTTRPHMVQDLNKVLKVDPFQLEPLTEQNQVDFLTGYWTHKLDKAHENKEKCEKYAKVLIERMSSWTQRYGYNEDKFTAVALQLRMLAEIFQENITLNKFLAWEGCKGYLEGTNESPNLPGKIEIKELYDLFIERKRHIYIQKGNPTGNPEANTLMVKQFNDSLTYHRRLALEVILSEEYCQLFSCYQESSEYINESILKIGIVQKSNEQLYFIHRTFAEYFVAECLVSELQLQSQNPNVKFQEFFIENVSNSFEYETIRAFLDSFLQNVGDAIPSNIFNIHQSQSTNFRDIFIYWIFSVLVSEGRVAVLQLIIKCMDFKIIKNESYSVKDLRKRSTKEKYLWKTMKRGNVAANSLNALKIMLQDMRFELRNGNKGTVLMIATERGYLKMAKFLVGLGVNVNGTDQYGFTALHLAVGIGRVDIIHYLVENGADIDCRSKKSYTPLHIAAIRNDLACFNYLVKCGADVTVRDNYKYTLLHFAVTGMQFSPKNFYLEPDKRYNSSDNFSMNLTLIREQRAIIKLLVERNGDINIKDKDGYTPIHFAAKYSHPDTVKLLHELGGNLSITNDRGRTALHFAAKYGHLESVKYLVEFNKDVDIKDDEGYTPLLLAAAGNHINVVKFLQRQNANINVRDNRGKTVLHISAENGYIEEYFIKCIADINTKDDSSCTALHLAAEEGHIDVVNFLCKMGADINIRNGDDKTPLHIVAEKYTSERMVKSIHELGADLNMRDGSGRTALHLAAASGHLDTVAYLLEVGADVNARDDSGGTALHSAIASGNLHVIESLHSAATSGR